MGRFVEASENRIMTVRRTDEFIQRGQKKKYKQAENRKNKSRKLEKPGMESCIKKQVCRVRCGGPTDIDYCS